MYRNPDVGVLFVYGVAYFGGIVIGCYLLGPIGIVIGAAVGIVISIGYIVVRLREIE